MRQWWHRGVVLLVALVVMVGGWIMLCDGVSARVMQEHLPGGVTLDKSLRTVKDEKGYSWQAIAFKTTQNGTSEELYLRLVGFPGAIAVDRTHPLIITTPSGQSFSLEDKSFLIFKNGASPQPNVAQYAVGDVLSHLQRTIRLRLTLPILVGGDDEGEHSTAGGQSSSTVAIAPLELSIPKSMVDEWFIVAHKSETK